MTPARVFLPIVALTVLTSCTDAPVASAPDIRSPVALVSKYRAVPIDARVEGQYLVVLPDSASDVAIDAHARRSAEAYGGSVLYTYHEALKGYAIRLGSAADAELIAHDPQVAYVEEDQQAMATQTVSVTVPSLQPTTAGMWGLSRINQRSLPLDNFYTYVNTGSGVTVFILDTGIRTTNVDFEGRASYGTNFVPITLPNLGDCNGHGTHVAGTVGSKTYGVAKKVKLVSVRVLDCNGLASAAVVAAGLDWVTARKAANPTAPMIANLSLTLASSSTTVDNAVNAALFTGVVVVVAAGNSNALAASYSPARVPGAITVSATTRTDARYPNANYGSSVDLFAPGDAIQGLFNTSDASTSTAFVSGTSAATPFVSGLAAQILQVYPAMTAPMMEAYIKSYSTKNLVTNPGLFSPNNLLYAEGW
jgi:subtilisin family serine protease